MLALEAYAETTLTEAEENELLGIIANLNSHERVFSPLAMQKLLTEANQLSEQLKLPPPHPIFTSDLIAYHISPPWFGVIHDKTPGLSEIEKVRRSQVAAKGFVETTNYSFSFADGGFSVVNKEWKDEVNHYNEWVNIPSLIDTNGAYQLATQWLAAAGVKMGTLQTKYGAQGNVEQSYIWNPVGTTNKAMLPLFEVTWGNDPTHYSVEVRVSGITKKLLDLRVNEASISRRPPLVLGTVADIEKFLNSYTNLPIRHVEPLSNRPNLISPTNQPKSP